jgi:prepilin-type N-terminal cleavage/methylation domain-containing protein
MVMKARVGLGGKNRTGFTLIELLAAMAITAIIGVALTTSIFQMMTIQSSTKDRVDAVMQLENAMHYVNQDAQMAFPSQTSINTNSNYFELTSLTSAISVGSTLLNVTSVSGFKGPGTVRVGSGATSETLVYTLTAGNTITVSPATKAHSSGDQVSNAMTLRWTDTSGFPHLVSYSLLTASNITYLQRSETTSGGPTTTLRLASNIIPSTSYYTFDGHVLIINLTATVSGLRSASETRTLVVRLRPTM